MLKTIKVKDFIWLIFFIVFTKYIFINDNKYFINDINPYCAFWIYDKNRSFKKFINTKIWKFNWKKKLSSIWQY
jgi:hypothetical protein